MLVGVFAFGLAWSAGAQDANPSGPVSVDTPAAPSGGASSPADAPASVNEALESTPGLSELGIDNPVSLLLRSGEALDAMRNGVPGVAGGQAQVGEGVAGGAAAAASGSPEQGGLSTTLSILLLLTVLTLVPAILVMCTSFTRIVVVLALLRQALGTQSLPPTQVVVGLSLFLTFLVMAPTLERINADVLQPMQDPDVEMSETEAWDKAKQPLRDFMFAQIDHAGNWDSVYMLMEWREPGSTKDRGELRRADVDMLTLIPAFMISELKVAFLLGFRLYLPFLVIDMVISSVLISMGMLMLPPVLISLPFKLLLFVLVDGWNLVVANLLSSFVLPGAG
ncbi:MAG: flagellar type III secretion system pore protein FliP [Phycisphaeraceae bacterium]